MNFKDQIKRRHPSGCCIGKSLCSSNASIFITINVQLHPVVTAGVYSHPGHHVWGRPVASKNGVVQPDF